MTKKTHANTVSDEKSNSVLYLALLCILYLLITSNYLPGSTNDETTLQSEDTIYIEILADGVSTVSSFDDPGELAALKSEYSVRDTLQSGDRVLIDDEGVTVSKMSGRKRISLGVPIGINSATAEDLTAIPGIGDELSMRIIEYREINGEYLSLDQLDNVEGIGQKKLSAIKEVTSVD